MNDSAETQATCRVIYLRVTPDELQLLKSQASDNNVSLQRHARIALGLTDRGGYRYRKEQSHATQKDRNQKDDYEANSNATLPQGDTESELPASAPQRLPLSGLPLQCPDQVLSQK